MGAIIWNLIFVVWVVGWIPASVRIAASLVPESRRPNHYDYTAGLLLAAVWPILLAVLWGERQLYKTWSSTNADRLAHDEMVARMEKDTDDYHRALQIGEYSPDHAPLMEANEQLQEKCRELEATVMAVSDVAARARQQAARLRQETESLKQQPYYTVEQLQHLKWVVALLQDIRRNLTNTDECTVRNNSKTPIYDTSLSKAVDTVAGLVKDPSPPPRAKLREPSIFELMALIESNKRRNRYKW